ncbi:SEC-C metal-binding domain-containing protein [Pseudoalteromonas sp. T1lg122]|uniref:SEC-C metal-binding domain-containing protein n=1 Tax=Pseudoalteromonas sp. T1lg122 TaxID=2077094 RepID=UPI000CF693B3|nr:SEC-C metal-binding domain-containing protein [Pseudoalteromonas sp. T1lg122]
MKMGRNESCWCGSNKKFKHCHYGREKQASITKGEAIDYSQKNALRKYCSVPDELKHECSKKIINAHTISKSGSLKEIADESNHVLGLKISLPNLIKSEGKLTPEKIGINQASTFKGFCSVHDKSLFACIEDREFVGDEEQCLALMYRSIAKELYAKEGGLNTSEFIKGGDKGKGLMEQLFIQKFVLDQQKGIKAAIQELSEVKSKLDDQLLKKSYGNLSHLIIESESPMPVAVSSVVAPITDFDGNFIQDLGDLNVVAEQLIFNSFSSNGKGYVVFSWLTSSTKVLAFINSLLAKDTDKIFSGLIRFFYGAAENTFTSPEWWNDLTVEQKGKIEELIMSGVNPFEFEAQNLLRDDGIDFSGWEIGSLRKVNF